MNALISVLATSARFGSALLAFGIMGGLLLPPIAHILHGAMTFTVVAMTTLVLLRVDIAATLAHLRRPLRLVCILATLMLICPLLTWLVVRMLPLDPGIAGGIIIFSTAPVLVSAPALARLLGLDADIALICGVVSTILVPLIAPPLIWLLTGVEMAISPGGLAFRLAIVVTLPLILSAVIRRLVGLQRLGSVAEAVDGFVVWLLVVFAFGVMDGIGARFVATPLWMLQVTLIAGLVVIGLNLVTSLILLPFGVPIAATVGMISGFRALGMYLAVLPAAADPAIALYFGLYQIPLYLGPLVMKPLYLRLPGLLNTATHA